MESAGQVARSTKEGFLAKLGVHGIPARALVIALVFGSLNAAAVVVYTLSRSEDLATIAVASLVQAYVLPLVFGLLSQSISYTSSRLQTAYEGVQD